jgi:hypothetical protein
VNDVEGGVFEWINNAVQYMAMADYPYPSTFLGPLPTYPVNASCALFTDDKPTPAALLVSMYGVVNMFYNTSGQAGACFNVTTSGPSTLADPGG